MTLTSQVLDLSEEVKQLKAELESAASVDSGAAAEEDEELEGLVSAARTQDDAERVVMDTLTSRQWIKAISCIKKLR